MAPRLMLFENKYDGHGNRTVTGETFVSKCIVNVNAYHKEGFYFIFYGTITERPSCASSKQFGGFAHVGLNASCSRKVSERQQRNNIQCRLRILLHQSGQTINYNKRDGIMQPNLSRDKVEIVTHFTTPSEMNRPRSRSTTGINQLR